MKRAAIWALMCVYLLSAIGVTATSFYCCGFLRSTSFSVGGSSFIQNNPESAATKCCRTTKSEFKVKDNHFASSFFFAKAEVFPAIIPFTFLNNLNSFESRGYPIVNNHAPPLRQRIPIYTLTCNYRI